VLRNNFSDRWDGHEESLDASAAAELGEAIAAEDFTRSPINAGQGVGGLTVVRSADQVIRQLSTEAAELLSRWARRD
jgi:nitronate monooxygenase